MDKFYTILGRVIWEYVIDNIVNRIQSMNEEEFNRVVQDIEPNVKRMVVQIRSMGR